MLCFFFEFFNLCILEILTGNCKITIQISFLTYKNRLFRWRSNKRSCFLLLFPQIKKICLTKHRRFPWNGKNNKYIFFRIWKPKKIQCYHKSSCSGIWPRKDTIYVVTLTLSNYVRAFSSGLGMEENIWSKNPLVCFVFKI